MTQSNNNSVDLSSGWDSLQNLTDRYGAIIDCEKDINVDAFQMLQDDEALLSRLRDQMVNQDSFIAHLGGKYGILIEIEYRTKESEGEAIEELGELKSLDDMILLLISRLPAFREKFPSVKFGILPEEDMFHNHPALWAFFEDGILPEEERHALHRMIIENDDDALSYQ